MRLAFAASALTLAVVASALVLTRFDGTPGGALQLERAHAEGNATLNITGLDVGRGEQAIVRLHNTSKDASNAFTVHYTIFAMPTLNGNPVALSQPGAGNGARLAAGDTLELDLGPIIDAYRIQQEAGPWDAPVRFVAFATGGTTESFGPDSVIVEALQSRRRATYPANVTWTGE